MSFRNISVFIFFLITRRHIFKTTCETGQICSIPFTVRNVTMEELFLFSDVSENER